MEKNLTEMLADLRLDLKDAATTWSDAELTRCVERAVSDLSRVLPREKSYELTVDSTVSSEAFTTLAALSATGITAATDISATSSGDTITVATQPDQPRPLSLKVTDANASITSLTVIVKGYGIDQEYIEETFYLSGGLIQTGTRYFRRVSEVEVDVIAGNGAGDTLSIGTASPTGVWIQLANHPIRPKSETASTGSRDSDFIMDYENGRLALITGTTLVANTAYTISYTKSRISIDTSVLLDLMRIDRVEHNAGSVPQSFVSWDMWGDILTLTGTEETQTEFSDSQHILIRYLAEHTVPNAAAPGSYPQFLNASVELAASSYALFIEALQHEHQAATDLASARTSLGSSAAKHTLSGTALTAAATALAAATTALGSTKVDDFLSGSSAPSGKKYLDDGDAYVTTVNVSDDVPQKYSDMARAAMDIARGFIAQAEAHTANGRAYIEQGSMYIYEIDRYLEEASRYIQSAEDSLNLSDRYRQEAIEKRNEAWSIWRNPGDFRGDFTTSSTRQTVR